MTTAVAQMTTALLGGETAGVRRRTLGRRGRGTAPAVRKAA
jgi:hypothetical protein